MAKSVFLTGASSGLGQGMARGFARRGYRLAIAARRVDKLEALAEQLRRAGAPAVVVQSLDVTDFASIPGALEQAAESLGGLDIAIANSGIGSSASGDPDSFDGFRQVIETNLLGAVATIDAAVRIFRKQGQGHVVGISSVAAVRGMPGQGAYAASKSGLTRYLEALRCEVANQGIVVTDLAPGFIDTDINRHMKSRPFVVSAEKGSEMLVALIEKKVGFRYVPVWPWTIVAQVLKILPNSVLSRSR